MQSIAKVEATGKIKPILFSAPMVRAILDGRKTMTRRIVKPQPPEDIPPLRCDWFNPTVIDKDGDFAPGPRIFGAFDDYGEWGQKSPYTPGDILWVRETWGYDWYDDGNTRAWKRVVYRADEGATPMDNGDPAPWKPSIFMPRWASRIWHRVTDVRAERVQEITWEDIGSEGLGEPFNAFQCDLKAYEECDRVEFRNLWNRIHGPNAWDRNPFCWVISFERIDRPEGV